MNLLFNQSFKIGANSTLFSEAKYETFNTPFQALDISMNIVDIILKFGLNLI